MKDSNRENQNDCCHFMGLKVVFRFPEVGSLILHKALDIWNHLESIEDLQLLERLGDPFICMESAYTCVILRKRKRNLVFVRWGSTSSAGFASDLESQEDGPEPDNMLRVPERGRTHPAGDG